MSINERGSGVLLPVFSLPGKYGIGCFSKEAFEFVDFLSDSKQKYWQILPLGPTSYGDSPYQSFSTMALNPYYIDPDTLMKKGLLSEKEAGALKPGADFPISDIDYEWLYNTRLKGLRSAYNRFKSAKSKDYEAFCKKNEDWLDDYATFMVIKNLHGDVSFDNWPEELRIHEEKAVLEVSRKHEDDVEFYKYIQYEAYVQWSALKAYANEKGISIIGDIPIYVAYDSADVWTHPELFKMDKKGKPSAVAGCPPDGFSADGQLWGNPIYDWAYHKRTGYAWWCRRIEKCREMYDVIRIDHFRGFDEYYCVPADSQTARHGKWCKGPGIGLFKAIEGKVGKSEIIAEDLGYITDSVKKLVRDTGFPNMKVLEFAFDSRDSSGPSEYLPHNYAKNCVVYTGTHDNETLVGWLSSIRPAEVKLVKEYTDRKTAGTKELASELIRLAHSSTANLCIIPLQDYLGLGNTARINKPSTLGGNWRWRMTGKELNSALSKRIAALTKLYGRQ